jgi:hypothetical protein
MASVPIPKFALLCGTARFTNFGIEGRWQIYWLSVALVQKSA